MGKAIQAKASVKRITSTKRQRDDPNLLQPGVGILKRSQLAKRTRYGLLVQTSIMSRLITLPEQDVIRNNPRTPNNVKILISPPFNDLSIITEQLGLTGGGGIVKEKFDHFPRLIGCLINVTYEVPLLKLNGIESYRVPVEDDRREDISIYFDEVTAKIHSIQQKGQATIVHCMAGVSRSATFVLGVFFTY